MHVGYRFQAPCFMRQERTVGGGQVCRYWIRKRGAKTLDTQYTLGENGKMVWIEAK